MNRKFVCWTILRSSKVFSLISSVWSVSYRVHLTLIFSLNSDVFFSIFVQKFEKIKFAKINNLLILKWSLVTISEIISISEKNSYSYATFKSSSCQKIGVNTSVICQIEIFFTDKYRNIFATNKCSQFLNFQENFSDTIKILIKEYFIYFGMSL